LSTNPLRRLFPTGSDRNEPSQRQCKIRRRAWPIAHHPRLVFEAWHGICDASLSWDESCRGPFNYLVDANREQLDTVHPQQVELITQAFTDGTRETFINVALRVPTFLLARAEQRQAFVTAMTDIIEKHRPDTARNAARDDILLFTDKFLVPL
jgi:hypothetical protein